MTKAITKMLKSFLGINNVKELYLFHVILAE